MKRLMAWGKSVACGFLDNHCSMHAAGLTYFSLLAVVPVLCVLLVGAKACGVDDYVRREANNYLDVMIDNLEHGQDDQLARLLPSDDADRERKRIAAEVLAREARTVSDGIFARIDGFDIRTFGWIGFGLLLWTVISSIGRIEVSFNEIWKVPKARPVWKRAGLYLGLVVVLPFFVTLALSPQLLNAAKGVIVATLGATWLTQWVSDGLIWVIDWWVFRFAASFCFSSLAFAVFFFAIPNCRVRFRHAWYGGAVTAVLFGFWMKVCAVAQVGISKSSAMYGSFAFLPIVLTWLFMSWQVILLGANMVRAFGEER